MAFAPEASMRACLAVLYHATLQARLLGYEGLKVGLSADRSKQLAALMDAVHNIPDLLSRWETCDEPMLVAMLREYDERWSPVIKLAGVYKNAASGI